MNELHVLIGFDPEDQKPPVSPFAFVYEILDVDHQNSTIKILSSMKGQYLTEQSIKFHKCHLTHNKSFY